MSDSKLDKALAALNSVKPEDELQDQLLQIARGALLVVKKRGTGLVEDALFIVSDLCCTADGVGMKLTGELMGENYGPFVQHVHGPLYYN